MKSLLSHLTGASGTGSDGARHRGRVVGRDLALALIAVLLVASPLLFTNDGFALDFTNAIWLVAYQQHVIAAHLHPSLFLQTQQLGVFYPLFAFYGGTLFAITGALAVVLGGSTLLAFIVVTLAGIAAAYGGLVWLAHQVGVRGALAHAPALVFVTSAYYVTDLYGRGAWAEFMAVSALPLMCAASLRLVRAPWRVGPVLCLITASVFVSGSHNITLLWAVTLTLVGLSLYLLLGGSCGSLGWRRIAATFGLIVLGIALNGWFLLPDIFYSHQTVISTRSFPASLTAEFNNFGVIFNPLRSVPESETPALYAQAPVLALAWGVLAAPFVWRRRHLRAGLATALIVLCGLLILMISASAWSALPPTFRATQYPYRLQTYVTLACSSLVLLGSLALTRADSNPHRLLRAGLWLAIVVGVGLSAWQLWVPNTHMQLGENGPKSYSDRSAVLESPSTVLPKSWYAGLDYADNLPVVEGVTEFVSFEPTLVKDDRLTRRAPLPQGPFVTNITGGPNLVHIGGEVRVVGRTEGGNVVLERTKAGTKPVAVELSANLSMPVILGRITSIASAVLLLGGSVFAYVRRGVGLRRTRFEST